jgi:hypothetical protein
MNTRGITWRELRRLDGMDMWTSCSARRVGRVKRNKPVVVFNRDLKHRGKLFTDSVLIPVLAMAA